MDKSKLKQIIILFFFLLSTKVLVAGTFNINDSITRLIHVTSDSVYTALAENITQHYFEESKYDEAVKFLNNQIQGKKANKYLSTYLQFLVAKAHYRKGDYSVSLKIADSILKDSAEMGPDMNIKLLMIKGQSYFRLQEFLSSLNAYEKAQRIIIAENKNEMRDDVLINIAVNYWTIGSVPIPLKYAQEAEQLSRATNDSNTLTRVLNVLGNINMDLKNADQSKHYFEECFAVAEKINDLEGMTLSLTSMAMMERRKGNLVQARELQQRALTYAQRQNSKHLIGGMLMNIANVLWDEGKRVEARKYLMDALTIANAINDKHNIASIYANLGFLATEEGDYNKSNDYLTQAVNPAKEINNLRILEEVMGGFYDNYKALKQPAEALKYHELYSVYADSLMNAEKANQINNLKTKFAVETKERELELRAESEKAITDAEIKKQKLIRNFSIAGVLLLLFLAAFIFQRYRERHHTSLLLAEKNQAIENSLNELKETQGELVETEKQREAQSIRVRIARDIHDEIGSGLTKITLLSDITRRKTPEPEIAESLSKITSYSKNVSTSLNEIVWAINPVHDSLASLVTYMKNTANNLLEDSGINYQLQFPEKIIEQNIHPDLKRNIYLVMKEAINNALKYADAKNIVVKFNIENGVFYLEVNDDGNGFSIAESESSNMGNGLLNMRSRMEQVNCKLAIETSPGNGCTISASGKF